MTIPDADYIREAEQKGVPPYRSIDDFDVSHVESEFDIAGYHIGQAIVHLCRAGDYAEKFGLNALIDELIGKLDEDFREDMDSVLMTLKEEAK